MYFWAAASLGKRPRQHELGLKNRPSPFHHAVQGGRQKADYRMLDPPLDGCDDLAGVSLEPVSIEPLGHDTELHNQIAREVLRFGLVAFLLPKPEEGRFVRTHDDAGV
jgi:hypothetical protein